MNVELLREVAKKILKNPRRFDMTRFNGLNECGTTHCIGGWARKISGEDEIDALGITGEQAKRLFYVTYDDEEVYLWPKRFIGRQKKGLTRSQSAWRPTPKQAAARIEHFIKTGGAE